MLVAYFDESGTTDADDIALYGGAVADTLAWAELERPWKKKLREFELSEYHAVDCEAGRREFARYQRPIREAITRYLASQLGSLRGVAFGSGVFRTDWDDAPREIKIECDDDPVIFSLAFCFQHIS